MCINKNIHKTYLIDIIDGVEASIGSNIRQVEVTVGEQVGLYIYYYILTIIIYR